MCVHLQCLENLRCSDLLNAALNEASSVTMPNSIKNDPKLFRDDIDIRFSRSLNSCKVPQVRAALTRKNSSHPFTGLKKSVEESRFNI